MNKSTEQLNVQKIAIFGGAFNPPTLGHLSLIKRLTHFDQILLVPSFQHAWGKIMAPFNLRCKWIESFISDSQLPNLFLCTDEEKISKGDAVTTWALLNHLQQVFAEAELTFVIGPDNLLNIQNFYRVNDILANWNIFCCPQLLNIRSTKLREALINGESIADFTTPSLTHILRAQDFITK